MSLAHVSCPKPLFWWQMDPTGSDARASNNAVEQHSVLNSVWFWHICSQGGRGWSPVTGKLYGRPVFPEQKPRTTGDEEGGKKQGRRGNETLADASCALGGGGTVSQRGRRPSEGPTPAVEGAAAGGQRCAAAAAKNRERLSREKKGGRGRGRDGNRISVLIVLEGTHRSVRPCGARGRRGLAHRRLQSPSRLCRGDSRWRAENPRAQEGPASHRGTASGFG